MPLAEGSLLRHLCSTEPECYVNSICCVKRLANLFKVFDLKDEESSILLCLDAKTLRYAILELYVSRTLDIYETDRYH